MNTITRKKSSSIKALLWLLVLVLLSLVVVYNDTIRITTTNNEFSSIKKSLLSSSTSYYYQQQQKQIASTRRQVLEQYDDNDDEKQEQPTVGVSLDHGGGFGSVTLSSKPPPSPPTIKFVFVIGLEGTGHHRLAEILKQAPVVQDALDADSNNDYINFTKSIHHKDRGYLNLHCEYNEDEEEEESEANATDVVTKSFYNLVHMMKTIAGNVQTQNQQNQQQQDGSSSSSSKIYYVPLNAIGYQTMASYPQGHGDCRSIRYPNLNILYELCHEAKLDCSHVYLYRDPIQVLQSTVINRRMNSNNPLKAIHQYTTMLSVIYAQLSIHASRTVGCWTLYNTTTTTSNDDNNDGDNNESNSNRERLASIHQIREMFSGSGVDNEEDFDTMIESIYHSKENDTNDDEVEDVERRTKRRSLQQRIEHKQYGPYVESMIRMHQLVVDLCHEQVKKAKTEIDSGFMAILSDS